MLGASRTIPARPVLPGFLPLLSHGQVILTSGFETILRQGYGWSAEALRAEAERMISTMWS